MQTTNLKPRRQTWQRELLRFAPYIIGGLILIILPPLLPPYLQRIMTRILIIAIFGLSFDIVFGYTGLLSFGHAAYLGVAGYTVGILTVNYGIESFWLVAPASILMATLVAAIFGIVALRASGIYFLLVTFALGALLYSLSEKWYSMTGGTYGLSGIPHPDLGLPWFTWSTINFYYFVLPFFVISFFLLYRLVKSPFGYALQGIREDEPRMRALGYNTWLYKYSAFVIGGLFAGVAGMLIAYFNSVMTTSYIGIITSALAWLIVIIGGPGTLFGPVIGSGVIVSVEFSASVFTPERWPLILGAMFVIAVMFLRGGIYPHLVNLWRKVAKYAYGSAKD